MGDKEKIKAIINIIPNLTKRKNFGGYICSKDYTEYLNSILNSDESNYYLTSKIVRIIDTYPDIFNFYNLKAGISSIYYNNNQIYWSFQYE